MGTAEAVGGSLARSMSAPLDKAPTQYGQSTSPQGAANIVSELSNKVASLEQTITVLSAENKTLSAAVNALSSAVAKHPAPLPNCPPISEIYDSIQLILQNKHSLPKDPSDITAALKNIQNTVCNNPKALEAIKEALKGTHDIENLPSIAALLNGKSLDLRTDPPGPTTPSTTKKYDDASNDILSFNDWLKSRPVQPTANTNQTAQSLGHKHLQTIDTLFNNITQIKSQIIGDEANAQQNEALSKHVNRLLAIYAEVDDEIKLEGLAKFLNDPKNHDSIGSITDGFFKDFVNTGSDTKTIKLAIAIKINEVFCDIPHTNLNHTDFVQRALQHHLGNIRNNSNSFDQILPNDFLNIRRGFQRLKKLNAYLKLGPLTPPAATEPLETIPTALNIARNTNLLIAHLNEKLRKLNPETDADQKAKLEAKKTSIIKIATEAFSKAANAYLRLSPEQGVPNLPLYQQAAVIADSIRANTNDLTPIKIQDETEYKRQTTQFMLCAAEYLKFKNLEAVNAKPDSEALNENEAGNHIQRIKIANAFAKGSVNLLEASSQTTGLTLSELKDIHNANEITQNMLRNLKHRADATTNTSNEKVKELVNFFRPPTTEQVPEDVPETEHAPAPEESLSSLESALGAANRLQQLHRFVHRQKINNVIARKTFQNADWDQELNLTFPTGESQSHYAQFLKKENDGSNIRLGAFSDEQSIQSDSTQNYVHKLIRHFNKQVNHVAEKAALLSKDTDNDQLTNCNGLNNAIQSLYIAYQNIANVLNDQNHEKLRQLCAGDVRNDGEIGKGDILNSDHADLKPINAFMSELNAIENTMSALSMALSQAQNNSGYDEKQLPLIVKALLNAQRAITTHNREPTFVQIFVQISDQAQFFGDTVSQTNGTIKSNAYSSSRLLKTAEHRFFNFAEHIKVPALLKETGNADKNSKTAIQALVESFNDKEKQPQARTTFMAALANQTDSTIGLGGVELNVTQQSAMNNLLLAKLAFSGLRIDNENTDQPTLEQCQVPLNHRYRTRGIEYQNTFFSRLGRNPKWAAEKTDKVFVTEQRLNAVADFATDAVFGHVTRETPNEAALFQAFTGIPTESSGLILDHICNADRPIKNNAEVFRFASNMHNHLNLLMASLKVDEFTLANTSNGNKPSLLTQYLKLDVKLGQLQSSNISKLQEEIKKLSDSNQPEARQEIVRLQKQINDLLDKQKELPKKLFDAWKQLQTIQKNVFEFVEGREKGTSAEALNKAISNIHDEVKRKRPVGLGAQLALKLNSFFSKLGRTGVGIFHISIKSPLWDGVLVPFGNFLVRVGKSIANEYRFRERIKNTFIQKNRTVFSQFVSAYNDGGIFNPNPSNVLNDAVGNAKNAFREIQLNQEGGLDNDTFDREITKLQTQLENLKYQKGSLHPIQLDLENISFLQDDAIVKALQGKAEERLRPGANQPRPTSAINYEFNNLTFNLHPVNMVQLSIVTMAIQLMLLEQQQLNETKDALKRWPILKMTDEQLGVLFSLGQIEKIAPDIQKLLPDALKDKFKINNTQFDVNAFHTALQDKINILRKGQGLETN